MMMMVIIIDLSNPSFYGKSYYYFKIKVCQEKSLTIIIMHKLQLPWCIHILLSGKKVTNITAAISIDAFTFTSKLTLFASLFLNFFPNGDDDGSK